jgi:outer membrane protein assembly factor BamB
MKETVFARTLVAPAILLVCQLLASIVAAEGETEGTWPQWRGPSRDGRYQGTLWPDKLDEEHLKSLWSVPLGPGYSGPIVATDRVFVTETLEERYEVVRALDRVSGDELWRAQWEGAMRVPFFAAANGSWIRSTPAFDGQSLYVAGMRDVLICLDSASGETRWRVDFVEALGTPLPEFGFASSPLLVGDALYVQAGAGFIRMNPGDGTIVWRTLEDSGGMYGSAFSSPVQAEIQGQSQLIVQTRSLLAGVDPADGRVLWQHEVPAFRGMNILTPTVIDDKIFTSSYGGRSTMLAVTRSADTWQVEEVWTHKSQGYMSSPVVIGGHIYLHLRNQRFICLDAGTGEEKWTSTPFGKYWSMVVNGDRILALDQRGELLLLRGQPEQFELLDRRKIADDSWAHVAVSGDEVFVRALDALTAYRWR